MGSNYENLEKLNDLLTRGVITQDEFNIEKDKILNKQGSQNINKLLGLNENNYCMLIHLSLLLCFIQPLLGLMTPFLLWVFNKDNYTSVDNNGRIVFNWIISLTIYTVIFTILTILLFILPFTLFHTHTFNISFDITAPLSIFGGFYSIFILVVLMLINVVFVVIGAFKASSGIYWNYPLSIHFLKLRH